MLAELELSNIAWLLVVLGLLLAVGVLFSRAARRFSIPVFLLFMAVGMLAGSEGLGGIAFENHRLTFRIGTLTLALILFDGGLNTPLHAVRRALAPAAALATVGVVAIGALVALAAHLLGFPWPQALLLGAVVSSTDAAALFSVLRASGLQLRSRVGATLELESGLNDPMAVLLTLAVTEAALGGGLEGGFAGLAAKVVVQLLVGGVLGAAVGGLGVLLLRRSRLPAGGLYPVFTLALALLAFALPTLLHGSGFLAVYVAGIVLGNAALPYQAALRHFHDALAWFSQVAMFAMLGLLSFPSRILEHAWSGVALGLFLSVVARPLVCVALLRPFRFSWRESLFVGWVGLRGAVPIILALFPILSGVAGASAVLDVVFGVVVLGAVIPGGTVPWAARRLGIATAAGPPPSAVLEITSLRPLSGELASYAIDAALPVCGVPLSDIPFPGDARALLIVRGAELIAARGETEVLPGDHVYLFCRPDERPLVDLLFGRAEEE
jgi:potassium/hydrogen antiporter